MLVLLLFGRTRRFKTLAGLLVRFTRALNFRRFATRFVEFLVCLDANRKDLRLLLLKYLDMRSKSSGGKFLKLI
jgi:hypothetical protein